MIRRGREFVQLPGPSNVPERVLRAMSRPATDFAGPEFVELARSAIDDLRTVFGTTGEVFAFVALGHGVWEAALANLVAPGETVLVADSGRFARGWRMVAEAIGAEVVTVGGDLRRAVDPAAVAAALEADRERRIRAVMVVQIETSTGIVNDIPAIRRVIDATGHPALLLVDAVASLAVCELRMDRWGVDLAVAASQKGLMMPPGLGFLAVGPRAAERAEKGGAPRRYWDWRIRRGPESYQWFNGTPPVQMMYGLREALDMLFEEGLDQVLARHRRLADAVRAAVARWSEAGTVAFHAREPAERCDAVTALRLPEEAGADAIRAFCRDRLSVAFGGGLPPFEGRMIRIGHLGDLNEPMILGALAALELAFRRFGIDHAPGGVEAAIRSLAGASG